MDVTNLFYSIWSEDLSPSLPSLKKSSFPSLDYALFTLLVRWAGCWLSDLLAVRSHGSLPGGHLPNGDGIGQPPLGRASSADTGKMKPFLAQVNPVS